MNSREILLYYSLKFNGEWDPIFAEIKKHEFADDEEQAKKLIKTVKSKWITFIDPEYPESLKMTYKPPFVLFYYGDISLISDTREKMAVVGSRKNSDYGKQKTEELVGDICKDFVIVSGMAYGIDAIAQRTCIKNGGKTISVLGSGIDVCYPPENIDIYEACKEKHLVISEFPNDLAPTTKSFPIRNRIIAGLCQHLLIPEGKMRSGTQITAFLMLQKSSNICCVPERAGEDSLCNHLIAEGAFLVETSNDIYESTRVVLKKPIFE